MNNDLLRPFTKEEIGYAVKIMVPLKAPSIDDFPALFYQRYWHFLGADISKYCLSILNDEVMFHKFH